MTVRLRTIRLDADRVSNVETEVEEIDRIARKLGPRWWWSTPVRVSETFHETAGELLVFALRLLGDHSNSFGKLLGNFSSGLRPPDPLL